MTLSGDPKQRQMVWEPGKEISGFQMSESQVAARIPTNGRKLLEEYVGLKPDEVVPHVVAIQRRAYAICPPGCIPFIGFIRFLSFPLLQHPAYPEVLSRLTPADRNPQSSIRRDSAPQTLLDLGCCFGQDMRQLLLDGADLSRSVGVDIESSFLTLGHELFRDGDGSSSSKHRIRFEVADIFDTDAAVWSSLQGKVDIVHASNFFHTFDLERQKSAALQVGRLMRTGNEASGALVVGSAVGSSRPREVAIVSKEKTSFCHDEHSWGRLWEEVGRNIGVRFETYARLQELESDMKVGPLTEESMRLLIFEVRLTR